MRWDLRDECRARQYLGWMRDSLGPFAVTLDGVEELAHALSPGQPPRPGTADGML